MNLKNRVQRLESLLPQKDPWGQIYDAVVQMDMCTACLSEAEAMTNLGDRQGFIESRAEGRR